MKKCLKCEENLPNFIVINGKKHNICNRKYCLNCSPFMAHNTKNLIINDLVQTKKICPMCKIEKSIDNFYHRRNNSNCSTYCKECSKIDVRTRQRSVKQKAVDYLGGSCSICKYDKYIGALEFHHIDPAQKDFTIAHLKLSSFERIKPELDKCILVCANCHREIHGGLIVTPPIV